VGLLLLLLLLLLLIFLQVMRRGVALCVNLLLLFYWYILISSTNATTKADSVGSADSECAAPSAAANLGDVLATDTLLHPFKLQSEASFQSSISDWGAEHVLDSGIKLPPGTALYEIAVKDLRPTQLAVGMQQVWS